MKSKILYIFPSHLPLSEATFFFDLALEQIRTAKHLPHVLFLQDHVSVEIARRKKIPFTVLNHKVSAMKIFWPFKIRKIIKRNQFEVILVVGSNHFLMLFVSTFFQNTKKIWINHGPSHWAASFISHFLPCYSTLFFSNVVKEQSKNAFGIIPQGGYWKIPFGVFEREIDEIALQEIHQKYKNRKQLIGIVGDIGPDGGQMTLVDTIHLLKKTIGDNLFNQLNFMVLGTAKNKKDLKFFKKLLDKIHQYQLDQYIYFLGEKENIHVYLNAIDVLVFANEKAFDVQRDLMQAILQNTLIVTNDRSWPVEVIDNYITGIRYQGNAQVPSLLLKDIIINYVEKKPPLTSSKIESILLNAKEKILSDYNREKMIQKFNEVFDMIS
ncbi:MAG: hypothetical protein A2381_05175 [Bdellovibrionales bacterium RIFOXYB1_FULL_37_110]|nr:MAG: hypothetical protein A2417_16655 [Bdellovibrionales bacterium RIFOXYC1_FULL_37_79]OFZ58137.1 MAG: hypothetical protein A2381_05175 [Bdellovibrionales bacterium RIFOXYB1_FULL_37_110]OFZ61826.1 MAG: hypothetical protein A2577_18760 [Bdellovibrionales bacterium RIFOXYD1_FULL_36_51]